MRKKGNTKFSKALKGISILCAVLALLTSACLVGFLVIDIIGLNILVSDGPRQYVVQFSSQEITISTETYRRGAAIKIPENPTRAPDEDENYKYTYTFKGWDMTGDNVADILPHYAYYSFLAKAVYNRTSTKKPKTSSSNPEESSSGESVSAS